VVGVHSAKFDNEKDLGVICNVVLQYDVTHLVSAPSSLSCCCELGNVCGICHFLRASYCFLISSVIASRRFDTPEHITQEFRSISEG
jgi:hypothetical protein